MSLAADVLRGGLAVAIEAECPVAGGHSVDDPEPKYGMAVTGVAAVNCTATFKDSFNQQSSTNVIVTTNGFVIH